MSRKLPIASKNAASKLLFLSAYLFFLCPSKVETFLAKSGKKAAGTRPSSGDDGGMQQNRAEEDTDQQPCGLYAAYRMLLVSRLPGS